MELKDKFLGAAFWVGSGTAVSKVISAISLFVLAALLSPDDFGIVALANLVIMAAGLFRELGINRALIVQEDAVEEAAQAVLIINFAWNLLLYLLVFLAAPLIGVFFHKFELVNVIRIMGVSLLITAMGDTHQTILERNMRFRALAVIETLHLSLFGFLSILFAWLGYRYWSIVYATIACDAAKTGLLWCNCPWRFSFGKLYPDLVLLKKMFRFGKNIFLLGIIHFSIRNIDDFFIGRILGIFPLGGYNFAYRIANLPATTIAGAISKISLPTYAQISKYAFDLRNAYNNIFKYTAMAAIPVTVFFLFYIDDFLRGFYGAKWEHAILPAQILAISGAARALGGGIGSVFLALKKPHILVYFSLVQLGLLMLMIYPVTKNCGIVGVSILVAVSALLVFSIAYHYFRKEIEHDLRDLIKPILIFACLSVASAMVPDLVIGEFTFMVPKTKLILSAVISVCLYLACILLIDRRIVIESKRMLAVFMK